MYVLLTGLGVCSQKIPDAQPKTTSVGNEKLHQLKQALNHRY